MTFMIVYYFLLETNVIREWNAYTSLRKHILTQTHLHLYLHVQNQKKLRHVYGMIFYYPLCMFRRRRFRMIPPRTLDQSQSIPVEDAGNYCEQLVVVFLSIIYMCMLKTNTAGRNRERERERERERLTSESSTAEVTVCLDRHAHGHQARRYQVYTILMYQSALEISALAMYIVSNHLDF